MSAIMDRVLRQDAERWAEIARHDAAMRAEDEALAVCERLTHGEVTAAREQVAARREHAS